MRNSKLFLLFFLLACFQCATYDFFISQNFTSTATASGSRSDPFKNIYQAFKTISDQTSFSGNEIRFIFLSDYYIIKTDDFGSLTTLPYRAFNKLNSVMSLIPVYCFDNHIDNLEDCPKDQIVEIQYKCEYLRIDVKGSLSVFNMKITGRELFYTYDSILDQNCYLTKQGCCPYDFYFQQGTPNNRCLIENYVVFRGKTIIPVFGCENSYATITFTNVEVSNFNSLNSGKTYYSQILYDGVVKSNVTILLQNCNFYRNYLKFGIIYTTYGKNSYYVVQNTNIIDYNYFRIREVESSTDSTYLAPSCAFIFNTLSTSVMQTVLFVNNFVVNSNYILKIGNTNISFSNCTFMNLTSNDLSPNHGDGIILSFSSTASTLIDFSNMLISNITIGNYFVVIPFQSFLKDFAFISLHNNINLTDCTFFNITGNFFRYTNFYLIKIYTQSQGYIKNISINDCTFNFIMINMENSMSFIMEDLIFSNIYSYNLMESGTNSYFNMSNCTFINFTVLGYSNPFEQTSFLSLVGKGGLIGVSSDSIIIINNFSILNGSMTDGEGLFVYMGSNSSLQIINSVAKKISAKYGGTIADIQENSYLYIENSIFEDFEGNSFMLKDGTNITINNCKFLGASIFNSTENGLFYFFQNNTLAIQDSEFQNMYMEVIGGIIFCIHYNIISLNNVIFRNITVNGTYAFLYGQGNDHLNLTNCVHDQISVGSLFYFLSFQGNMSIYNNTFTNSYIFDEKNTYGAMISIGKLSNINVELIFLQNITILTTTTGALAYIFNSTSSFRNITLQNFYASNTTGLIYVTSFSTIYILNISMENVSVASGGVVYLDLMNSLIMTDAWLKNIRSISDGGIIYSNEQNTIDFSFATLYNIHCQRFGGLLAGDKNNIIQINNIEIYNSSAVDFTGTFSGLGEGGLIYLNDLNIIILQNVYFFNLSSERKGGAFSFFGGLNDLTLTNATFNISKCLSGNGGLLSSTGNTGTNTYRFSNISVIITFANNSGGIISIENNFNELRINACLFFDSIANYEFGGGIAIADNNFVVIANSTFIQLISNLQGGFLYSDLSNVFSISFCNIENVSAVSANGGLFDFEQSNQVSIYQSNFSYISSYFDGAGFYLYNDNKITITYSIFNGFSSKNKGGFVAAFKYNQIILNSSLLFNISSNNQGFLFYMYENNTVNFNNTALSNKVSNPQSSMFESTLSSYINITFCSFDFAFINSILTISDKSDIYIYRNTFTKESICAIGMQITNTQIKIKSNKFTFNVTNYFLYSQNSNIELKSCIFVGHDASFSAYFSLYSSKIQINGSIFTKNSLSGYTMIQAQDTYLFMRDCSAFQISSSFTGAFISLKNSEFNSKNNVFISGKTIDSGGMLRFSYDIEDPKVVLIKNSFFLHNIAFKLGGSIHFESTQPKNKQKLDVFGNKFLKSVGFRGGAIYVFNANNFTLANNSFIKNRVIGLDQADNRAKGGALFTYSDNADSIIAETSNIFQENYAEIGGAFYAMGTKVPTETNNSYVSNAASCYGMNRATDVKTLSFYLRNDQKFVSTSYTINDIQSGNDYSECLSIVAGSDVYANVVYNTDENYFPNVTIIQASQLEYGNRFSYSLKNGFMCFNGTFKRNQLPIQNSFFYHVYFKNQTDPHLTLKLNFRDCVVGERLTDDRTCDPCPINSYSFVTDFSLGTTEKCHVCDESLVFYCFGQSHLTSKKDYWRLNENSTNFIKCKNSACLGDPRTPSLLSIINKTVLYDSRYATSLCEVGYKGILCNECDDNYGHIDLYNCLECGSSTYNFNLIFALILRIIFTVYSVFQEYIMVCSICSANIDDNEVITTNILKTFVNHMQVLSIIRAFPFEWPSEFSFGLGLFLSFTPNVSEGLSLECMLKSSYFNINAQYFKLIICFIYPFVLTFLSLILIKIVQSVKKDKMIFLVATKSTIKRKRTSASPSPTNKISKYRDSSFSLENLDKYIKYNWVIASTFFAILILCFPDIIKVILSMFACQNFGDDNNIDNRLVSDYSVHCDSETHKLWTYFFGVPFLILMGIVFPGYVLINMWWAYYKKRMQDRDREVLLKYGFFFYAYKSKLFFWDLVTLIRKLFLLFINIFYMTFVDITQDLSPILLVFLILVVSVLLQYQFNPFDEVKFNIVNHVESVSLSCLVATALITLIYFGETSVGREIDYQIVAFLVIAAMVANLFFLAYFLKAFYTYNIKGKLKKAKEKSEVIFSKLKNLKASIKKSSLWNSISKRFSPASHLNSPDFPKSKSKPIALFNSNLNENEKKELFSPLKKLTKEEKKDQKKTLYIIEEIIKQRAKDDIERYNLLVLEQRRVKKKLKEMNNEPKETENDLGDEIPEERAEKEKDSLAMNVPMISKIYNNKQYYYNACLLKSHLLSINSLYSVRSKTNFKNKNFDDFYLKIVLEFDFIQEVDEFKYEIMNENGSYFLNLLNFF